MVLFIPLPYLFVKGLWVKGNLWSMVLTSCRSQEVYLNHRYANQHSHDKDKDAAHKYQ